MTGSGIEGLNLGGLTAQPESATKPKVEQGVRPMRAPAAPDKQGWWSGTGRRKTAVARVRIRPGNGDFKIKVSANKSKTIEEYFTELRDRSDAVAPLKATNTFGKIDVIARVDGGGYMGQAQAIRLGIARALRGYDPTLEGALRDEGLLTRDSREVERK